MVSPVRPSPNGTGPGSHPPPALPASLPASLPKASFRRIPDWELSQISTQAGVPDQQNQSYGFNDGSDFVRPEHYIRYVEPIESELKKQVEYDMDEQDQEWLDALNVERRKEQMDAVSYEVFEIIMDRLEKEWFDLMKRVPVRRGFSSGGADADEGPSEDSTCAICDDGECENSNAIVFCDGCNLAVHQDCYGVPYIPEGQWLCRKCTVSPERAVTCILCPHEGGAFKQTTASKWAHLLCAMWIPEVGVSNPVYMEPVDNVERIPKSRWRLVCYLCRVKHGACIQCDNRSCFTAFHVTCARQAGLLLHAPRQRAEHGHGDDDDEDDEGSAETLKAFCHRHVLPSMRDQVKIEDPDVVESGGASPARSKGGQRALITPGTIPKIKLRPSGGRGESSSKNSKSARAYGRLYTAGPPLVPRYIVTRVLEYIAKVSLRKKQQLVALVCRFWSLKREARRGAPLLKRLHLEPWTASASSKEQTDAEKAQKLQFLLRLREDLEKIRMLAELVRKREKEKLRQCTIYRSALIDTFLFPHRSALVRALDKIQSFDRIGLFRDPVNRAEVPDYYDIVKKPMDWTTIQDKLDDFEYFSVEEFKSDVNLIFDNAILYNKPDTTFYRAAQRMRKATEPILAELEAQTKQASSSLGDDGAQEDDNLREELGLEPEQRLLDLLGEYSSAPKEESADGPPQDPELDPEPRDAVDDLLRQHYAVTPPPKPVQKVPKPPVVARKRKRALEGDEAAAAAVAKEERRVSRRLRGDAAPVVDPIDHGPGFRASTQTRATGATEGTGAAAAESESAKSPRASTMRRDKDKKSSSTVAVKPEAETPAPGILEVDQLDSKDEFLRFNEGWVLPRGLKRGGRPPPPPPPPKRVRKSSNAATQASIAEDVAEDVQDVAEDVSPPSPPPAQTATQEVMEGDKHGKDVTASTEEVDGQQVKEEVVTASTEEVDGRQAKEEVELLGRRRGHSPARTEPTSLPERDGAESTSDISSPPSTPSRSASGSPSKFPRDSSGRFLPATPEKRAERAAVQKAKDDERNRLRKLKRAEERRKREERLQKDQERREERAKRKLEREKLARELEDKEMGKKEKEEDRRRRRPVSRERSLAPESLAPPAGRSVEPEQGTSERRTRLRSKAEAEVAAPTPSPSSSLLSSRRGPERSTKRKFEGPFNLAGASPLTNGNGDTSRDASPSKKPKRSAPVADPASSARRSARDKSRSASGASAHGHAPLERDRHGQISTPRPSTTQTTVTQDAEEELTVDDFEPGTLIWARMTGYPYFPAEVWDDTDSNNDVPDDVLDQRDEHEWGTETSVVLVRFFDTSRTWAWLPPQRLRFMLENDELDQKMLKNKEVRTPHMRSSIRSAYGKAKAVMEV